MLYKLQFFMQWLSLHYRELYTVLINNFIIKIDKVMSNFWVWTRFLFATNPKCAKLETAIVNVHALSSHE